MGAHKIVNQITEPPFYLVGVFIHNLYVVCLNETAGTLENAAKRRGENPAK